MLILNQQLIEDISYDLKIEKYPTEKDSLYQSRIIYSAISLWMKYIMLDHMINKEETEVKSKNYHYRRSAEVFNEYMTLFPEVSNWMHPEGRSAPINLIRNRLMAANEINEVDIDGNITLAKKKVVPLDNDVSRLIEISTPNTEFKYVGLTKIIKATNGNITKLATESSLEIATTFMNLAFYQPISKLDFRYEVINLFKKGKYDKHWLSNQPLNSGLHLIRKQTKQMNYYDSLVLH